jgi:hypothetical protein
MHEHTSGTGLVGTFGVGYPLAMGILDDALRLRDQIPIAAEEVVVVRACAGLFDVGHVALP